MPGANVFRLDRECERPLLPKRMELLAVFLRAAIAFGAALVAVDVERDGIVADRLNAECYAREGPKTGWYVAFFRFYRLRAWSKLTTADPAFRPV
jgi:hypothetical protein